MVAPVDGHTYALPRLSIVLPARDEEDNVAAVVRNVLDRVASRVEAVEVIVVDDGSRDRTAERVLHLSAERPEVRLVVNSGAHGYGSALRAGFDAARFEWVFYTDADGQFPLEELPDALSRLSRCDAVVGYRHHRADPLPRRVLGRAWTVLVGRVTGLHVRDVNCAFKLFPRSILDRAGLSSNGAAISAELLLALAADGLTVDEVGVEHRPRLRGDQTGARAGVAIQAVAELAAISRRARSVLGDRRDRRPMRRLGGDDLVPPRPLGLVELLVGDSLEVFRGLEDSRNPFGDP